MLGELHAWNAQANNQLMIFNRIIFCFVRVCPSVCVCRGCETRSPRHPLPKSLANTKEQPNSRYKAAHCEWFNIWAATSATRRAAWLGEEAKTHVACGQRRPFRRRDGIKNLHYSQRRFVSLFNVPTDFERSATTPSSLLTSTSNSAQHWTTSWFSAGTWSLASWRVVREWTLRQTVKRFNPHPFTELAAIFIVL